MTDSAKEKQARTLPAHSAQPNGEPAGIITTHEYLWGGLRTRLPIHLGTLQEHFYDEEDPEAEDEPAAELWLYDRPDNPEGRYVVEAHRGEVVERICAYSVLPVAAMAGQILVHMNVIYDLVDLAGAMAIRELSDNHGQLVAALQMISNCAMGLHHGMGTALAGIMRETGGKVPGLTVLEVELDGATGKPSYVQELANMMITRLMGKPGGKLDA